MTVGALFVIKSGKILCLKRKTRNVRYFIIDNWAAWTRIIQSDFRIEMCSGICPGVSISTCASQAR